MYALFFVMNSLLAHLHAWNVKDGIILSRKEIARSVAKVSDMRAGHDNLVEVVTQRCRQVLC
jgi:hypothetical protein